jgi:hypothetical protein
MFLTSIISGSHSEDNIASKEINTYTWIRYPQFNIKKLSHGELWCLEQKDYSFKGNTNIYVHVLAYSLRGHRNANFNQLSYFPGEIRRFNN